ncbi:MAG: type I methionyl aminopeptidase [Thiolinea sp.]
MRVAGRLAASVLDMIGDHIRPGVTTNELNQICHDYMVNELDAIPAPLNYGNPPFPKSICTSINEQVCHGIPSEKKLKKGDALNIDVTVIKTVTTAIPAKCTSSATPCHMYSVWRKSPSNACTSHPAGASRRHSGDIGHAIQTHAEQHNYSVVREFCGHGIGKIFHEAPQILHYGKAGEGDVLQEGMIFTIEPMINQGKRHIKILADQWTAVTKDRRPSAQWEHTVLVTNDGFEILTLRHEENGWQDRLS